MKKSHKAEAVSITTKTKRGWVWWLLVISLALNPLISSFYGIDLSDTGLHFFFYENLFSRPELLSFTSFFSSVIGHIWLQLFSFLGLWSMNLLEVLLEYLICVVVYRTFHPLWGKIQTLTGLLLASLCMGTYLNAFNYHQFNALFLVLISCAVYKALQKDRLAFSFFAGLAFASNVFSRVGSITGIVFLLIYSIPYLQKRMMAKRVWIHVLLFLGGAMAGAAFYVVFLFVTGLMPYFINNLFRLGDLATAETGSYSFHNLFLTFVISNSDALLNGLMFLAGGLLLAFGNLFLFRRKAEKRECIADAVIGLLFYAIAFAIFRHAYDIIPAPPWPQMSTGPTFVSGLFYICCIFYFALTYYAPRQADEHPTIAATLALYVPLLTIAGSATGIKHAMLAMWIIAPLSCHVAYTFFTDEAIWTYLQSFCSKYKLDLRRRSMAFLAGLLLLLFLIQFLPFVYRTNNFDSMDRLSVRYTVDHPRLHLMHTTERQALAMQGVLQYLEDCPEGELIIYGSSGLLYYLSARRSYVKPWTTAATYYVETLQMDIQARLDVGDSLPIFLYGRTNTNYGFGEADYEQLIRNERRQGSYGKKDFFELFLTQHNYRISYVNDYYAIALPPQMLGNREEVVSINNVLRLQ